MRSLEHALSNSVQPELFKEQSFGSADIFCVPLMRQQRLARCAPAAAAAQALGEHGLPAHLERSVLVDVAADGQAEHL
jgi:hypothetical protein